MTKKTGCLIAFLGFAVLGKLVSSTNRQQGSIAAAVSIPFESVKKWEVGEVVVIPDSIKTAEQMRSLGKQLFEKRGNATHWFVDIYNDARAAGMRDRGMSDALSKQDEVFWERHRVGSYSLNRSTRIHDLYFWPNGTGSKDLPIHITY